jgi:hypothetical protein
MKIERRLGAGLTVTQARELFAIAEKEFNLEAGGIQPDQLVTVQG